MLKVTEIYLQNEAGRKVVQIFVILKADTADTISQKVKQIFEVKYI